MNKGLILLLVLVLNIPVLAYAQTCDFSFFILDQTTLNQLFDENQDCEVHDGPIFIDQPSIVDLTPMANVRVIRGDMWITNTTLTSLTGLESLDSIYGNIIINDNDFLIDLGALEQLSYIEGIVIRNNTVLESIDPLPSIDGIIDRIVVQECPMINKIIGFTNIHSLEKVDIDLNQNLDTLIFLQDLVYVEDEFKIHGNPIKHLKISPDINFIGDDLRLDDMLVDSLPLFNKLDSVGAIAIFRNDSVKYFNGFQSLKKLTSGNLHISTNGFLSMNAFSSLEYIEGAITIQFNSNLKSILGFNSLLEVGERLVISSITELVEIVAFQSLERVDGGIDLSDLWSLENIDGFQKLEEAGSLILIRLWAIENLDFLESIQKLSNWLFLNDLTELNDISAIGNIEYNDLVRIDIRGCWPLEICNYPSICNYISEEIGLTVIQGNSSGCNSVEEILEACITNTTDDQIESNIATIVPNPSIGAGSLIFNQAFTGELQVYDVLGRKVLESNLSEAFSYDLEINTPVPQAFTVRLVDQNNTVSILKWLSN